MRGARVMGCCALLALLPGCDEEVSRRPGGDGAVDLNVAELGANGDGAADQGSTSDGPTGDLTPVDQGGVQEDGAADLQQADLQQPDQGSTPTSELLLFDGNNLQFTTADNGFHPLIKPGDTIPASNWLTPVDYYDGEIRIRYVINSPANQAAGKLQTCIWTMGNGDGDGKNYFPESCSDQVAHTGVGEYFNTKPVPATWWKNSGVPLDFTHPEWFLIRVVLRGTSGCNVTTYSVANACWSEWPSYQNMKFRVTLVMVPKGATFSGWANYP